MQIYDSETHNKIYVDLELLSILGLENIQAVKLLCMK